MSTSASTRTTCATSNTRRKSSRTTPNAPWTSSTATAFQGSEWGELEGIANRTDFDLKTHTEASGADLSYFDQSSGERFTPYVIEPAAGLSRSLMTFLLDAYTEDEAPNTKGGVDKRVVLKLDKRLAPIKVAVLPLSRNADLTPKAKDLAAQLRQSWMVDFDDAGAIGRRYRRQDEIGTPFCITVDFDTLDDHAVTVRERDSMVQERVALDQVEDLPGKTPARLLSQNRGTMTAVLPPLQIGRHTFGSPVVLAPMAGITNRAFRRLCREYGDAGLGQSDAAGVGESGESGAKAVSGATSLYVSEMVTSRALVERTPTSMQLIEHDPDENPRSIQLYGVDPATVAAAVRLLVSEDRADHIDLNFGCPVPKVTRKGGGAALPWKTDLFRAIVSSAVKEATPYAVPVTVKMRKGIDSDHLTFLEAGRIAEGEGVAAVALHARTASQAYSGQADWSAIKALKQRRHEHPGVGQRRHLVG